MLQVTGQNRDGIWSPHILLVHEESKEAMPRVPTFLRTEPGPPGSLWATSLQPLFSAPMLGFPNFSAVRDEEKGSLHC